MSNKTLVICGDSWFSTDNRYYGQSFGEVLATRHNLQLESLARSGCSNFTISLQVDKAIEMNPDFIIVGCTDWARVELPIDQQSNLLKDFLSHIKWPIKSQEVVAYRKSRGLLNIKYSHSQYELSAQYSQPAEETIISESINNLIWHNRYNLSDETIQALEQYILHIYDSGVKQQMDCWIMSEAARRLLNSGIPFLIYTEPLFNHDFIENIDWLDKKYRVMYYDFSIEAYPIGTSLFHLTPEHAYQFAEQWEQRLITEGFLNG
jgi:hypothetical protein